MADSHSERREPRDAAALQALATLGDPTRRRLYEHVAAAGQPVTRDAASAALDVDRSVVAYHLDKLVEEGLLTASFARAPGRGGPGAGRPAKRYARPDRELAVSVPPRDYELLAELFAQAIESDSSGSVRAGLERAARETGRGLAGPDEGSEREVLVERLARRGFEPYDDDGVVRLRNCPFHRLAREHTEVVCSMNLALLTGLAEALGTGAVARLDPGPDRCCVAFDPV